jgi:biopolymer transport protein ExbD
MAAITKKKRPEPEIPNASMSDIAFLLLIFFMVSTVFVKEKGLKLTLPQAESIQKIPRKNSVTLYISPEGKISIDDLIVPVENVYNKMLVKKSLDPYMLTCFRTDKNTEYGVMADIMSQMRDAETLRVSFEAKLKR